MGCYLGGLLEGAWSMASILASIQEMLVVINVQRKGFIELLWHALFTGIRGSPVVTDGYGRDGN